MVLLATRSDLKTGHSSDQSQQENRYELCGMNSDGISAKLKALLWTEAATKVTFIIMIITTISLWGQKRFLDGHIADMKITEWNLRICMDLRDPFWRMPVGLL